MKPAKKPSAKPAKIKSRAPQDNLLDLSDLFLPDDASYQKLITENAQRLYGIFRAALPTMNLPGWDEAELVLRDEFLAPSISYSIQYGFHPEHAAVASALEYAHNVEMAMEAKRHGHDFVVINARIMVGNKAFVESAPVMSTLCKPTCKACHDVAREALVDAEHDGRPIPTDLPGVTLGEDRESLEMRVVSLERRVSMLQGGDYDSDDFGK